VTEQTFQFKEATHLVGILTLPPDSHRAKDLPAVVLLNSGIVHRVGPNRIYVKIARHLAAHGFPVLRFDFSGIGDSRVRKASLPFDKCSMIETQDAMDQLSESGIAKQFLLMGICSGATASLFTAQNDTRVAGVALINRDTSSDEETDHVKQRSIAHYYLTNAIFNPRSWRNLITFKSDYRGLLKNVAGRIANRFRGPAVRPKEANPSIEGWKSLADRGSHVLLVCSEHDYSYYSLQLSESAISELRLQDTFKIEVIWGANHTFDLLQHQQQLLDTLYRWASSVAASLPTEQVDLNRRN
jgi:pimeloyl-ACP methyl ester carboxylesterase